MAQNKPTTFSVYGLDAEFLPPTTLLTGIMKESVAVAKDSDQVVACLRGYAENLIGSLIALPNALADSRYSRDRVLAAHIKLSQTPVQVPSPDLDRFVRVEHNPEGRSYYVQTSVLDDFVTRVVRATYPKD